MAVIFGFVCSRVSYIIIMKNRSLSSSTPSLSLAFFGFTLVGIAGGVTSVLLPSLDAFYHVGDATLGLLFLGTSLGYFLAALGSGLLAERLGLRWFLILGAIIVLVGQCGSGLRLPFVLLLCMRTLVGFGIGIIETGFNVFVTAQPRHTVLLNYLHAFYGVGALLSPLIASNMLAFYWPWYSVYLLTGVLSLPLALGVALLLRVPLQLQERAVQKDEPLKENVLRATLRYPVLWLAILFLLVYVGIEVSIGNWSYTFLLGARHQGTLLAGWIVSGFWLGLTLGRFALQAIAERFGMGVKALLYACILAILLGLLLVWLIPLDSITAFGFCLIGLGLAPIYPITVALTPQLVPARLNTSAIGLMVSMSTIGLALFPWMAGVLSQAFGIWTLLPYSLLLTLLLLGIWRFLARKTTGDTHSSTT